MLLHQYCKQEDDGVFCGVFVCLGGCVLMHAYSFKV